MPEVNNNTPMTPKNKARASFVRPTVSPAVKTGALGNGTVAPQRPAQRFYPVPEHMGFVRATAPNPSEPFHDEFAIPTREEMRALLIHVRSMPLHINVSNNSKPGRSC